MNIDQIHMSTHKLRLFGIHHSAQKLADQAAAKNLSHLEFLNLILQEEDIFRKNRTSKTLATKAKFKMQASLEDWDTSFDRGITKTKLKELSNLSFLINKESVIVVGKTGEGKSHLCVAVGRRLCLENVSVQFLSVNLFFQEVQAEKAAGRYLQYLGRLSKTKVLIFDDFGLRNYTHDEAITLMDVLEDRYQKNSIIMNSQVDPKGWKKLFEDPVIAEAIVDRIINPSQIITLKGGSYREKLELKKTT